MSRLPASRSPRPSSSSAVVKDLRAEGVSIIYISHRLSEVQELADRVVVLRDGKNAGTLERDEIRHDRMVQMMVGRDLTSFYTPAVIRTGPAKTVCFEVKEMRTRRYPNMRGVARGSSRRDSGSRRPCRRRTIGTCGGDLWRGAAAVGKLFRSMEKTSTIQSPRDAIQRGIYLIPEDRRSFGLITAMTVRENITLPALERYSSAGFIRRSAEEAVAREDVRRIENQNAVHRKLRRPISAEAISRRSCWRNGCRWTRR